MSYDFARMYARKYPDRFSAVQAETKRGGAGRCRNIGIDLPIDCEYCYFLDSDDYLYSKQVLADLARDAKAADMPDMVLGSFAFDVDGIVTPAKTQVFERKSDRLASSLWNSASSKI